MQYKVATSHVPYLYLLLVPSLQVVSNGIHVQVTRTPNNASAQSAIECFLPECKRSPRCLQALAIQVYRCIARKAKMATKTIMGFRERLIMHAIFSDSTFGMTMYVFLCGYMKWNKLS